ncbi:MAG: hypothetical protein ABR915_15575, partial [Thermoguttaceae bacterium]
MLLMGVMVLAATGFSTAALAAPADVPHPFMLWDRADAARLKQTVESQPWARRRFEQMADALPGAAAAGKGSSVGSIYKNLFAYVVLGDKAAGRGEKQALMGFASERPEGKATYYSPFVNVLRYDALYDELSPAEHRAVEAAFRAFIEWQVTENKFAYSREFWLPNMQWNRVMGTHLMAVALRDEKLIRAVFASNGGWKFFFDDYIADGAFHFEEFAKQGSMITEMMLWCRSLERLGLDEMGFGYRGRGGGTMRNYLETYLIQLLFPRTQQGSSRPAFHRVTMGDAGTLHAALAGYGADGRGGTGRFGVNRMNGSVPRMTGPLVYEFAHAKWPDAGFDYFLAQERSPEEDKYYPSLIFLSEPIDPAKVRPPAARSFVAPERGFAFLKAEESPAYFEGPAPAVPLQLATYYMHYTAECFSLLGFQAYNRPLYQRVGRARGYGGGCPWTDNVRANCGVVVDGLRAKSVGTVPSRHGFY